NIAINNNVVENCDIGIEVASEHYGRSTESITVNNNLVYKCDEEGGISLGGYDADAGSSKNIKIYNNTVYNTGKAPIVIQRANDKTNEIYKNILVATNDAKALYLPTEDAETKNVEYKANQIYDNIISPKTTFADFKNNIYTTVTLSGYNEKNRTITAKSSTDLTGYGFTNTPVANEPTVEVATTEATTEKLTTDALTTEAPAVSEHCNIVVDGKNTDWKDYASLASSGNIKSIKSDSDDDFVYFCIDVKKFDTNYQFFINTDHNKKTGYSNAGYDYMIENNTLYKSTGSGWSWKKADASALKLTKKTTVLELSLDLNKVSFDDSYAFKFSILNSKYAEKYSATGVAE
ncbi:MAG: hypothetical protein Q4D51_10775, partial [Eubacteriales bacterium]|nr:hypothetical protein [Eubacteriales bacterium]